MNAADEDRRQAVRDAAAVWQRHLVDLGGRNSLLWQRTDDSVELDLTTAHPAGVAKLLSGRSVLLSQIVRSEHAYAEAYEKALAIRDLSRELLEERGILSYFLALGRATWQMNGDAVPAAPILLRQCDIHFGGRGGDDLVLEVSRTVELNSALSTYFASRGIRLIDFKLEFGKTHDDQLVLADEISPDTCRFWDMETGEKLDKDRFRRDLGGVEEAYAEMLRRVTREV